MPRARSRMLGVGLAVLLGGVIGLQLVRPELTSAPATADLAVPPPVSRILRDACYDCHSTETRLRWFDRIVPAYWLVADDVKRGRAHLSFSELAARPVAQQRDRLFEAVNHVRLGAMPPRRYTLLHPAAQVSPEQLAAVESYLASSAPGAVPAAARAAVTSRQYEAWLGAPARAEVRASPNHVVFPSGYREWKAISTTDRFDSNSLRVVLGNGVAIQAIAEHHTNPWPDGTIFAKVAWEQVVGRDGVIHSGPFQRVEFMVKDRKKYASTAGWGWARWRGTELEPQGESPAFAQGCVGCHAPMRKNDFVFTMPAEGQPSGPVTKGLPLDPFRWKVITSGVDPRDSTMSTLYGNDDAVRSARSDLGYPPGSILAVVTWRRQDDPHWFGAMIPGAIESIELITVSETDDRRRAYAYEEYRGTPLRKVDAVAAPARIDGILSQRGAVMP